jgi:hypothetical protein
MRTFKLGGPIPRTKLRPADEIQDRVVDALSPKSESDISSTEDIPSLGRLAEIEEDFSLPCVEQCVVLIHALHDKTRGGVRRRKRGSRSRSRATAEPRDRASRKV